MRRLLTSFLFVLIVLCLSSCAFHDRNPSSFPSELKRVYFSIDKPYSPLATNMNHLLTSVNVTLVKNVKQAPFSIIISADNFVFNRPDIVNTTLTNSINFMQTAMVSIINNHTHQIVISNNFATTQSLTININQIYTTDENALMQHELNREITLLIYYWLTSKQTKNALENATFTQPAQHTS